MASSSIAEQRARHARYMREYRKRPGAADRMNSQQRRRRKRPETRAQRSAYGRKYYLKNKKRILDYCEVRRLRLKNDPADILKRRARSKAYVRKNRKYFMALRRTSEHRARSSARRMAWAKRHPEKDRAYQRAWYYRTNRR